MLLCAYCEDVCIKIRDYFLLVFFFFKWCGDHLDLHVLTHSFHTRRSSDLGAVDDARDHLADIERATGVLRDHAVQFLGRILRLDRRAHRQRHVLLPVERSEEHTSELQSLMRISYAVFSLKKKNYNKSSTKLRNSYNINKQSRHKLRQ